MPVPVKLGVQFTTPEIDAIKAGIQVAIDAIKAKIILNLSTEEREELSKVGPERMPYVLKSVTEYGVMYPQFNPLAYAFADADKDLTTYGQMDEVLVKLTEANELAAELQMVAGHFTYLFMRKQYGNAESNKDENVPGAQVVYDGLKGCFEGQGPQGDDEDETNP